MTPVSWAAHQFEYYALQGHMPKRWVGQVSFLAIVAGDQSCDLVGKLWAYGFTIDGHHYGPASPRCGTAAGRARASPTPCSGRSWPPGSSTS